MSYYDGLIPTYAFSLHIERSDRPILNTEIMVMGTPEEIAKAKKNIRRLLADYTQTVKAPGPVPAPATEADAESFPELETQIPAVRQQQDEPTESDSSQNAASTNTGKPYGARGLPRLRCPACGKAFGTFLREYQTKVDCRCGHCIDLAAPLAPYRFVCPYCEKATWGSTNLEDPDITIRCKCGGDVDLRWNPKAGEYQD